MILKDREINNFSEIEEIINQTDVCYLAMSDNDVPYVLPFNFAYENHTIYLHSAPDGKKMDILKKNPKVCIAFCPTHELFHRHENVACSYAMKYQSVVLSGTAELINNFDEKIVLMNKIMKKYTGRDDFKYSAPAINNVQIFKIIATEIKGKKFKM